MISRALATWTVAAGLASAQPPTSEDLAFANGEFALWQQAVAALADQHDRTVGHDTATLFALGRVGGGDDAQMVERMLLVAEAWLVFDISGRRPDHISAAGIDGDWGRRVLCYVAGEGPGPAHYLIGVWGLPRAPAGCEVRFAEALDRAAEAVGSFPPGDGSGVGIRYGDDEWSQRAADHELLETVADALAAEFRWPDGLTLVISSCVFRRVTYTPSEATITLCAEMLEFYNRQIVDWADD